MRTKKEIRNGVSLRITIGFILMTISALMLIFGYLAHEYNYPVVEILKENTTSQTILIITTIIWFAVAILLFTGGLIVILFRSIRHHDYVERVYSSRIK